MWAQGKKKNTGSYIEMKIASWINERVYVHTYIHQFLISTIRISLLTSYLQLFI